jgi:hypothetical protein
MFLRWVDAHSGFIEATQWIDGGPIVLSVATKNGIFLLQH